MGMALVLEVHRRAEKNGLQTVLPGTWRVLPASILGSEMKTISVVLPCAFEGNYAVRTVRSIWDNTDHTVLKEIIVVDDGSKPPLHKEFPKYLTEHTPLRILRHETTKGLISAKVTGGNAAIGDVIVFLDCHVRPRQGWEAGILRQMHEKGDHRTVVVPGIGSLDPDTWEEVNPDSAHKACYLLWNADFTWLAETNIRNNEIPIASGGLLAISRKWWDETEGYDGDMVAWGGENIDQSLRTWLCGGRIEGANDAFIAHMWRDASKPQTQLKYPIPTHDVMRNKARAVNAWMDGFIEKTMSFPEYGFFMNGVWNLGDMTKFSKLKSKLKCKPFSSYVQKFSYIYIDGGLVPKEIFQLREENSGRCLERVVKDKPPHGVILVACASDVGDAAAKQLWHSGNADPAAGGHCCSGIMNWNFLQCLDTQGEGYGLNTWECELGGSNNNQHVRLTEDGQITREAIGKGKPSCVAPAVKKTGVLSRSHSQSNQLKVERIDDTHFRLRKAGSPESCAMVAGDENALGGQHLDFGVCNNDDPQQLLSTEALLEGFMIHIGSGGQCLDAAGGIGNALVYPCYPVQDENKNQMWVFHNDHLCWGLQRDQNCIEMEPVEDSKPTDITLATCSQKLGQRFAKHEVNGDTFMLRDSDSGKCLGTAREDGQAQSSTMLLVPCDEKQRWQVHSSGVQLQHVQSQLCLDEGAQAAPLLYACHTGHISRTQRFEVVDGLGVRIQRSWDDNGRKRFFERCVDVVPEPDVQLNLMNCNRVRSQGTRWSKINIKQPKEYEVWKKADSELKSDQFLK